MNCYAQQQIRTTFKVYSIDFTSYKDAAKDIDDKMHQTICQTVLYSVNGIEHIVTIPLDSVPNAPIHLIKKNGYWIIESFYPDFKMDGARNYSFFDTLGNFVYANTGSEVPQPWPLGDLVVVNTNNDKLKWTKVNIEKAFYHSVGSGDLNGDGLTDVVGLHMWSTYWGDNLHPFIQNLDGSFREDKTLISQSVFKNRSSSGAVLVTDIINDKTPEIIRGSYGYTGSNGEIRYAFEILGYDLVTKQFIKKYEPDNLGMFSYLTNGGQGATSIKSSDFNNDGFKDLVICSEGTLTNGKNGSIIQIWLNSQNGRFIPDQYIQNNADDSLNIREFEIADIDNDGWMDVIMHGMGGVLFREEMPGTKYNYFFKINNLIWKNTRGKFNILQDKLNVYDQNNIGAIWNSNFLKGFLINGKLKFIGFENGFTNKTNNLYEITVNFCNDLIKPTFNTTKYSFCTGDSLKLSITNVNKGDTLKWYFGSKSDISNVANKTFTDSSKVFVTRTDSIGCIISSDTIQLKKFAIPSLPTLSRDSENNLVSNSIGNIWYKDGVKITDTTQKIKPTSNGIYTATTTQNGCTSALSQGYYYLTNAVANLTNGEYFKISPNPTLGELNINYKISSSRNISISVFDINGRAVLLNKKVESRSKVNLGSISKGNYIIQVKDGAGRLISSQKLVKE